MLCTLIWRPAQLSLNHLLMSHQELFVGTNPVRNIAVLHVVHETSEMEASGPAGNKRRGDDIQQEQITVDGTRREAPTHDTSGPAVSIFCFMFISMFQLTVQ